MRGAVWKGTLLLSGQVLLVFALVALAGPGRIDITDGQNRYEVARSLVDHGDVVLRDPDLWFGVFPGRNGQAYSSYRLPQSVLGVGAILLADATGPTDEGRRHFFFTLTSALAGAVLAATYTLWFRALGQGWASALSWSCAGVFCTPSFYYATSSYDDILGTTVVVLALATAYLARRSRPRAAALGTGLLVGLAFHCKQPLGVFVLPVLALQLQAGLHPRKVAARLGLVLAGLGVALALYQGYEFYKFPLGTTADHAELMKQYVPNWPGNPLAALCGLAVSPAAGVLWYCPPLLIGCLGLAVWYRCEKGFCLALLVAVSVFVGFVASLTIFKGDPAWGPRYLTPVYALLWLFAPQGAARLGRARVGVLLGLGLLVQLLGLSVDPHRLYLQRGLPSAFYYVDPWLYFRPEVSHLLNRPREIAEILADRSHRAEAFTPSPAPTYGFLVSDRVASGPEAVRKYHVLNSFRPWWVAQQYLAPGQRPVDLTRTLWLLLALAGAGLGLMTAGARMARTEGGTA